MKREYWIYTLVRNGSIFYVGRTVNIYNRYSAHKSAHGEDIEINIIDKIVDNSTKASKCEKRHIERYLKAGHPLINKKDVKGEEDRKSRSYKIFPSIYEKATAKAALNNTTVANIIEDFLYDYISV